MICNGEERDACEEVLESDQNMHSNRNMRTVLN